MELSSRGQAPCSTGFPHQVSVLRTHLYQWTSWHCRERLCLASVNFSLKSFNAFAHFVMGDLRAHLKQKLAEALKGIKINEFKNCFE